MGSADAHVPGSEAEGKKKRKRGRQLNPIVELVGLVLIALLLALGIQKFLVKPYQIPSESMVPTLSIGQRVLVNRIAHRLGGDPKVGDVVVFHPPRGAQPSDTGLATAGSEAPGVCADKTSLQTGQPCPKSVGGEWSSENYIKRVVAGPGDTLSVRGGRVVRNGKVADEPFISSTCEGAGRAENPACNLNETIRIPAGHYYMMGDNRGESNDSRFWGPVPRDWVVGKAFATYWPPKKIGGV